MGVEDGNTIRVRVTEDAELGSCCALALVFVLARESEDASCVVDGVFNSAGVRVEVRVTCSIPVTDDVRAGCACSGMELGVCGCGLSRWFCGESAGFSTNGFVRSTFGDCADCGACPESERGELEPESNGVAVFVPPCASSSASLSLSPSCAGRFLSVSNRICFSSSFPGVDVESWPKTLREEMDRDLLSSEPSSSVDSSWLKAGHLPLSLLAPPPFAHISGRWCDVAGVV